MSAAAGRKWRAHPAAEQDLARLAEDDSRLPTRAIALLDLVSQGVVKGERLDLKPFYGDLTDCFKIYFGITGASASHRIVYRQVGDGEVEVIEVIAVETREDGYVYLLASSRMGRLPDTAKRAFNTAHQRMIATRGINRKLKWLPPKK